MILYPQKTYKKYQKKLCVKFQQLQTSTGNINEMSKSLKEFINVTDEILGYLQRDDLLGVPKNLFKRLFDPNIISAVGIAVLTISRRWKTFSDSIEYRTTRKRRNKVFTEGECIILKRCILLFVVSGFHKPVRIHHSDSTNISKAQKAYHNIPYRDNLYLLKEACISPEIKDFVVTFGEIQQKFLESSDNLIECDSETIKNYSNVLERMFNSFTSELSIVSRYNTWCGPEGTEYIPAESRIGTITRPATKEISSIFGIMRDMHIMNKEISETDVSYVSVSFSKVLNLMKPLAFEERAAIFPTRLIPDLLVKSTAETAIGIVEFKNMDMDELVVKPLQRGESLSYLAIRVLEQVQPYSFLGTIPVIDIFDGINLLRLNIDLEALAIDVPELTQQDINIRGNIQITKKLVNNIKYHITPFKIDQDGFSVQSMLISGWFRNLTNLDENPENEIMKKVSIGLKKVTPVPSYVFLDHWRSTAEIKLVGNLESSDRARLYEASPANDYIYDIYAEQDFVFTDVNVEKLSTIFGIRNPELTALMKDESYVFKIINSLVEDEYFNEGIIYYTEKPYLTCYKNELRCYEKFRLTTNECEFKFPALIAHGDIEISGLGIFYFLEGKYFIFKKLSKSDIDLEDSALKEQLKTATFRQVEILATKLGILHQDLCMRNLVINATQLEVTVTIIDYGYVHFVEDCGAQINKGALVNSYLNEARQIINHIFK